MLYISLTALFAVFIAVHAVPTPTNSKDAGPIGELPENWDQAKDDTQSLFLNKSDKNDLEPYPLALSEEGNSEGYEQGVAQRYDVAPPQADLDNLIMRPAYGAELYAEPPGRREEGLSSEYDSRRRKRGSGTKVGGAGAATKVATKNGSGKKNLKAEEHEAPSPLDSAVHDHDHRSKRGSGTKVGGAAASAKTATKNSGGNKKNFRPISERRKRDSGLSAADVRALLNLWEAQERRKQESQWTANQWPADRFYGRVNSVDEEQPEVDENGDIWYNEPVVLNPHEREYPHHPSYFSEQNRMALARGYPDVYPVDPAELAQRYEEARRKRQYANKMKRFMVARKRSDGMMHQPNNYRPRDDLYTLAELLRSAPRVQEQDIPVYRRLIL
ncbi:putative neuropeptide precursor protein isoform X1 [Leguminivora glycinivorella]|uniref:putative neuropeptide precursor protein isoform X1 n=1 Tax=Leguminivora glycinivorella TaxID=1035111 RepID=UPI00200F27B1|nr:putative neuropeptide precursor protein isoform X1 [Leguminivora glycinivorella]